MTDRYIKVAFNLPIKKSFWYTVPAEYENRIHRGQRVMTPFGNRKMVGFVVEKSREKPQEQIKEILKVIDTRSPISEKLFQLAVWISRYYCCSLGQALHSVFPFTCPYQENSHSDISSTKKDKNSPGERETYLIHPGREKLKWISSRIRKDQEKEQQTIIMVPEIALIHELAEKLDNSGFQIITFHSRLSAKQRFDRWLAMKNAVTGIVALGTRSTVFVPFNRIGSIIVDREESTDYKQKETPKYNASQVAIKRGELENFPVFLLSDVPSVESWYRAKKGIYSFIDFSREAPTLSSQIIDLKKEKPENRIFSGFLQEKIKENLDKDRLTMLFVPRRGFANFLLCQECGEVIRCPNCDIGLHLHLKRKLICHYCGLERRAPSSCPFCRGTNLRKMGWGTQRVEKEVKRKFPEAKVARFDLDIFRSSPLLIQEKIRKKEVNILVGTQLLIKEKILSHINLVGIILIDALLNLPDFRASERVFQLLARIRSGLMEDGSLVVQTYNPTYFPLASENREGFYSRELELREELGYPPYQQWIRIFFEGRIKKKVKEQARAVEEELRREKINFLGSSPCPFSKIKGQYRYHLIVREGNDEIKQAVKDIVSPAGKSSVKIGIDVDPLFIM